MYKIEKGISIPGAQKGGSKWDFVKNMNIGDSFFIPKSDIKESTVSLVYARFRRFGYKASYRTELSGFRFWRVK